MKSSSPTEDQTRHPREAIPQWALQQCAEILSRALDTEFVVTSCDVRITDIGQRCIMPKRSLDGFVEAFSEASVEIDLHFKSPTETRFRITEGISR